MRLSCERRVFVLLGRILIGEEGFFHPDIDQQVKLENRGPVHVEIVPPSGPYRLGTLASMTVNGLLESGGIRAHCVAVKRAGQPLAPSTTRSLEQCRPVIVGDLAMLA